MQEREHWLRCFVCTEEGTPKTERNVSGCLSLIPVHSPCICLPLFGFLAKQEVFWFPRSPNCPTTPTPWDEWWSPGDPVTVTCSGNLWRWLLFTCSSAWSQTRDGIHRTPEAASGEGTCLLSIIHWHSPCILSLMWILLSMTQSSRPHYFRLLTKTGQGGLDSWEYITRKLLLVTCTPFCDLKKQRSA